MLIIIEGTFISLRGTIVRMSSVKPLVKQMAFTCTNCLQTQTSKFSDGKYAIPTKCQTNSCKSRNFNPEKEHGDTITVDYQKIKIQEKLVDELNDAGRVPRT